MVRFALMLICLSAAPVRAADEAGGSLPVIDAVYGSGRVTVISGGQTSEAKEGRQLKAGDQVATDEKSAARLVYSDKSQLYVGRNSQVTVNLRSNDADATTLDHGKTRALVTKGDSGRTKFVIRTKSAVMGVRGTDFVAQTDPAGDNTQVHTLEGIVALAQPGQEASLFAGQGLLLLQNQFLRTRLGAAFGVPQAFKRDQFLKKLHSEEPTFKQVSPGFDQMKRFRSTPFRR
jgi:hypothetical protein